MLPARPLPGRAAGAHILKHSSRDTSEPADLEGAGVLEPEKALRLTQERLLRRVERTLKP